VATVEGQINLYNDNHNIVHELFDEMLKKDEVHLRFYYFHL